MRVYLDNAATTAPRKEVLDEMMPYFTEYYGNASSVHTFGQEAKKGLDIAHVGIAVWKRDGLHLLNASMIYKKVVEDSRTLAEYMKGRKTFTGIRVIRIRS